MTPETKLKKLGPRPSLPTWTSSCFCCDYTQTFDPASASYCRRPSSRRTLRAKTCEAPLAPGGRRSPFRTLQEFLKGPTAGSFGPRPRHLQQHGRRQPSGPSPATTLGTVALHRRDRQPRRRATKTPRRPSGSACGEAWARPTTASSTLHLGVARGRYRDPWRVTPTSNCPKILGRGPRPLPGGRHPPTCVTLPPQVADRPEPTRPPRPFGANGLDFDWVHLRREDYGQQGRPSSQGLDDRWQRFGRRRVCRRSFACFRAGPPRHAERGPPGRTTWRGNRPAFTAAAGGQTFLGWPARRTTWASRSGRRKAARVWLSGRRRGRGVADVLADLGAERADGGGEVFSCPNADEAGAFGAAAAGGGGVPGGAWKRGARAAAGEK